MPICKDCNKEFKHWGTLSRHTCFSQPISWIETKETITLDQYNRLLAGSRICLNCLGKTDNDKFCSRSCSATYNNKARGKKIKLPTKIYQSTRICKRCNTPFEAISGKYTAFCSNECSEQTRTKLKVIEVEAGIVTYRPTLKNYLIRHRGRKCEECGGMEWQGKPMPLELEHCDGDASNNFPSNLKLLCPNCHTFTPTYKGRNRGNGRQSRGMKSC